MGVEAETIDAPSSRSWSSFCGHARGLDAGDAHEVDVDALAADALVEDHEVAAVGLLAAALGVVLVDAADRLVREAQAELVDDHAVVAEVQRACEELEAALPRLARDVRERVAVEGVHAVGDRRAERHEVAQGDAVAGAVRADDHLLRPRADVAAHQLLGVLKAAAAEHDGACRRGLPHAVPGPGDRPAVLAGRGGLDARLDEHLGALAAHGVQQDLRPRPAPARPADGHQPAAAHAVLQARHRRVEREAVRLEPVPGRLDLVDEHPLQLGIAARDPLTRELVAGRRPDQAAAQRHRAPDGGLALEHQDVGARLARREGGRQPGHTAADDDHIMHCVPFEVRSG